MGRIHSASSSTPASRKAYFPYIPRKGLRDVTLQCSRPRGKTIPVSARPSRRGKQAHARGMPSFIGRCERWMGNYIELPNCFNKIAIRHCICTFRHIGGVVCPFPCRQSHITGHTELLSVPSGLAASLRTREHGQTVGQQIRRRSVIQSPVLATSCCHTHPDGNTGG